MTALTYGETRVPTPESTIATKVAAKAAPKKPVVTEAPRQGFFARFLAAMGEARLRHAERDIALYAPHIMPLLPACAGARPSCGAARRATIGRAAAGNFSGL
jgi:hypothetical protein